MVYTELYKNVTRNSVCHFLKEAIDHLASFKELSVFAIFMNARIQYALKFRNIEPEECTETDVQESGK